MMQAASAFLCAQLYAIQPNLNDFFHKRTELKAVEAYLDGLGARGWEVAGVTTPTNSTTVTVFLERART